MRFKAADRKCLEEKAQGRKHQSLSKKAKNTVLPIFFPHFLYCITGSCSYKIFHIKINNVSSVIIKYISVLAFSPV